MATITLTDSNGILSWTSSVSDLDAQTLLVTSVLGGNVSTESHTFPLNVSSTPYFFTVAQSGKYVVAVEQVDQHGNVYISNSVKINITTSLLHAPSVVPYPDNSTYISLDNSAKITYALNNSNVSFEYSDELIVNVYNTLTEVISRQVFDLSGVSDEIEITLTDLDNYTPYFISAVISKLSAANLSAISEGLSITCTDIPNKPSNVAFIGDAGVSSSSAYASWTDPNDLYNYRNLISGKQRNAVYSTVHLYLLKNTNTDLSNSDVHVTIDLSANTDAIGNASHDRTYSFSGLDTCSDYTLYVQYENFYGLGVVSDSVISYTFEQPLSVTDVSVLNNYTSTDGVTDAANESIAVSWVVPANIHKNHMVFSKYTVQLTSSDSSINRSYDISNVDQSSYTIPYSDADTAHGSVSVKVTVTTLSPNKNALSTYVPDGKSQDSSMYTAQSRSAAAQLYTLGNSMDNLGSFALDGAIRYSWNTPSVYGNVNLLNYVLTFDGSEQDISTNVSPYTVSSLTNGRSYSASIQAVYGVPLGSNLAPGVPSTFRTAAVSFNPEIPHGKPNSPSITRFVPGNNSFTVDIHPGALNGRSIDHYNLFIEAMPEVGGVASTLVTTLQKTSASDVYASTYTIVKNDVPPVNGVDLIANDNNLLFKVLAVDLSGSESNQVSYGDPNIYGDLDSAPVRGLNMTNPTLGGYVLRPRDSSITLNSISVSEKQVTVDVAANGNVVKSTKIYAFSAAGKNSRGVASTVFDITQAGKFGRSNSNTASLSFPALGSNIIRCLVVVYWTTPEGSERINVFSKIV